MAAFQTLLILLLSAHLRAQILPTMEQPFLAPHRPDFTLIILPDTQYYTQEPDNPDNPYYLQAEWIVAQRQELNIAMALHMGDITHTNDLAEWLIADQAHAILEAGGVPYGVVPGNHDYPRSDGFKRDTSLYNDFFGPGRFAGAPWYGGHYGSDNDSNYLLFDVGTLRFLVVNLEFAPRKEVLCWASDLIAAHSDRRVIIVTHCYQNHYGDHRDDCADYYNIDGSGGGVVWDELASRHSNVFMVLSGHIGDSERRLRISRTGDPVHEILTDYQFEIPCTTAPCTSNCGITGSNLGNGWLRALHFQPSRNRIQVETISVVAGDADYFPGGDPAFYCVDYAADPLDPDHSYVLEYSMTGPPPTYRYADGGGHAFHDRTVNSVGAGQQMSPVVTVTASSGSVVVWEDDQDHNGYFDIYARGLAPGGCESFPDLVVCSQCDYQQSKPAVAADATGSFFVTWEDDHDNNGIYQIYARGFNADGSQRFPSMTINSVPDGQQRNPRIAAGDDGRFVVVWEDDQDNNGYFQIKARVLDSFGEELVADFTVNTLEDGQQLHPSVAMDAVGRFVVAWEDDRDDNGYYQIYARCFEADGNERCADFTVNSTATGQQLRPAVAMEPDGGFVIAFEDDQDRDGHFDVRCRGFDSLGGETFSDRLANGRTGGQHRLPSVAMDAEGAFVICWEDDNDNNGTYQIWARGFTATGEERIADFNVNDDDDGQMLSAAVAMAPSGPFTIVWQDDRDGNGYYEVVARGFEAPGP
jgi:hypothetical protein